jgi:hypothetical protein
MKVLVCGSRNWTDDNMIRNELVKLSLDSLVITGMASGADSIAMEIAHGLGLATLGFPAQWHRYGKSAGPRRNQDMLLLGRPELVLAFTDVPNVENAKTGTSDMVRRALDAGIPVRIFRSNGIITGWW